MIPDCTCMLENTCTYKLSQIYNGIYLHHLFTCTLHTSTCGCSRESCLLIVQVTIQCSSCCPHIFWRHMLQGRMADAILTSHKKHANLQHIACQHLYQSNCECGCELGIFKGSLQQLIRLVRSGPHHVTSLKSTTCTDPYLGQLRHCQRVMASTTDQRSIVASSCHITSAYAFANIAVQKRIKHI